MAGKSDNIEINPKDTFIKSLKEPHDFRVIVNNSLVLKACEGTLAQMAMEGYTREQLNGAIAFMNRFLNFSEPVKEPVKMPVKVLSADS